MRMTKTGLNERGANRQKFLDKAEDKSVDLEDMRGSIVCPRSSTRAGSIRCCGGRARFPVTAVRDQPWVVPSDQANDAQSCRPGGQGGRARTAGLDIELSRSRGRGTVTGFEHRRCPGRAR